MVDIEGDALARQTELVGGRLDDPRVRLMGHEQVEIGRVQTALGAARRGCASTIRRTAWR